MKVVAIGVSAGGPETLKNLFSRLERFSFPVLLVQHNLPDQVHSFAQWLSLVTEKDIVVVKDDVKVEGGRIYVPAPYMDLIMKSKDTVGVSKTEGPFFPSIDKLFTSVARSVGKDAIAIVLGGLGGDGVRGSQEIARNGGLVIVQKDAKFPYMPISVSRKVKSVEKTLDEIVSFLESVG